MRGSYVGDARVHSKKALESGNFSILFGCASGMFSGVFTADNAGKLTENSFYKVSVEIESTKSNQAPKDGEKVRWFSNIKRFDWEKFEKSQASAL